MSRTSHRVDSRELPLEPLTAAAPALGGVPPLPERLRRKRTGPRYWLFRLRVAIRQRRLNGDGALLVLCVLLMVGTIAGAISLVSLAH